MNISQRIIFSDNGVLVDWTPKINDPNEFTVTPGIVAAEDYIYIASILPFNHKWVELAAVNDQAANVSVEIWNNTKWEAAVDEIDYTALGDGNTLSKSGVIQFRPHIDRGWTRERLSKDVEGIGGLDIYNMYWARLKFSADLAPGTEIKYIGTRFADDDDLYLHYPDLRNQNLKTAFQVGKTDWADQHFSAAAIIVNHLISKAIIVDKSQILDWSLFKLAAVHKVAELAYHGLGKSKEANEMAARKAYDEAINMKRFKTDTNADGELDAYEIKATTGEFSR